MSHVMEIYTSAPRELDSSGSREIGEMRSLRIVSVGGKLTAALDQLVLYRKCGFFASVHRSDALEFVAERDALERRIDDAFHEKWRNSGVG